jgi:hypothetical protein
MGFINLNYTPPELPHVIKLQITADSCLKQGLLLKPGFLLLLFILFFVVLEFECVVSKQALYLLKYAFSPYSQL